MLNFNYVYTRLRFQNDTFKIVLYTNTPHGGKLYLKLLISAGPRPEVENPDTATTTSQSYR